MTINFEHIGTDASAWAGAYLALNDGERVSRATVEMWFRAAMQAGYNMARPLDPDVIEIQARPAKRSIKREYVVVDSRGVDVCRVTFFNDLSVAGASNVLNWNVGVGPFTVCARDPAERPSAFGYIGATDTMTFVDTNNVPDVARTPAALASEAIAE